MIYHHVHELIGQTPLLELALPTPQSESDFSEIRIFKSWGEREGSARANDH